MIVLDTCVVSESMRPTPSPEVVAWIRTLPESRVFLPSLVVGEIRKGIALLSPGAKRSTLELWFQQLCERFRNRILALDEATATTWGALAARLEAMGRPAPLMDSLIAAYALRHTALLATRSVANFAGTGVEVVSPWEHRGLS